MKKLLFNLSVIFIIAKLGAMPIADSSQIFIHPSSLQFTGTFYTKPAKILNHSSTDTLVISNIISSNSNYYVSPTNFPIIVLPLSEKWFDITFNYASGFQLGNIEFFHNFSGSPISMFVSNQPLTPLTEGMLEIKSGPVTLPLSFGLDTIATDGLDEILEEFEIPPLPPAGGIDARFILPENYFWEYNTVKDYRYGNNLFSGQVDYKFSYQPYNSYGIEIFWFLPPGVTGFLRDIINGSFINVAIADSGSYVVVNPLAFSKLNLIIHYNEYNPIELISFNYSFVNTKVQLNWTTATETNNSGFEILRFAQNDNEWEAIGFVPGFGTTTEPKAYSFTDENVTTGTYKYHLKQIDFDGIFEYLPIGQAGSNEIEVEVDFTPKEFVLFQNYPNPFNPNTVIRFEIPGQARNDNVLVTLKIYDILGNEIVTLVNEEKQSGVYEVEFDASSLASGMYLYKLQAGSFIQTKKMILTK
ncbi:MAG: T9SS type A sorting domain-containing protein [Ignavibacteria bacterium]|nr:T9SS type A sorting domain-containing protein [Ignavibacteria bacterium]